MADDKQKQSENLKHLAQTDKKPEVGIKEKQLPTAPAANTKTHAMEHKATDKFPAPAQKPMETTHRVVCVWANKVVKAVKVPEGKGPDGEQLFNACMRDVHQARFEFVHDDPEILPRFMLEIQTQEDALFREKEEYELTIKHVEKLGGR